MLGYSCVTLCLVFCSPGNGTQGFLHARLLLYPLSHIPSPSDASRIDSAPLICFPLCRKNSSVQAILATDSIPSVFTPSLLESHSLPALGFDFYPASSIPNLQSQGGHLFNLSIHRHHSPPFTPLIFCRFPPDLQLSGQTQHVCKGECGLLSSLVTSPFFCT